VTAAHERERRAERRKRQDGDSQDGRDGSHHALTLSRAALASQLPNRGAPAYDAMRGQLFRRTEVHR
jgi:hypothetical protein